MIIQINTNFIFKYNPIINRPSIKVVKARVPYRVRFKMFTRIYTEIYFC